MGRQKTFQSAHASTDAGPDLALKFMRENPAGSLPDPVEIPEGRDKPFAGDVPVATGGETPADAIAVETPVETVETPATETPAVEATPSDTPGGPIGGKPAAEAPVADAKPAEPAAPAAAAKVETPKVETPAGPTKLNLEAQYDLDGSGTPWGSGLQILDALQERAHLIPKAQEAEKFTSLFGRDYQETEKQWKPFLEHVAAAPEAQRAFAEKILLNADPALLDYLQRSEAHFYDPEGGGFQRPAQPEAKPADAVSPQMQRFERVATQMEKQLIQNRVTSERSELFSRYPFLAHNQKAYQALTSVAAQYYSADEAAGKTPLECRGLLDAMRDQAVFLDTMAIAASQASAPREELKPGVGAPALLPGSGPGAAGVARPAPPREYHGDPAKAREQFMQDYPD